MGANGAIEILFSMFFPILNFCRSQNLRLAKTPKSRLTEVRWKFQIVNSIIIFNFSKLKILTTPGFSGKSLCNPFAGILRRRRETSLFPEPTSLRCNVRSEDYTGQRDYAACLHCVSSARKTGRTHSADHLCLTPRRKATCGTGERTPSPLRVPVLALRVASRSQNCWLALKRLRQKRSSRPGTTHLATRRRWHE